MNGLNFYIKNTMEDKIEKVLTKKQEMFVNEYIGNGGNKELAYKSAYGECSPKTLHSAISRLVTNPLVIEKIKDVKKHTFDDRVLDNDFFRRETLQLYHTAKALDDITNARKLLGDLEKYRSKEEEGVIICTVDFSHLTSGSNRDTFNKNMGIISGDDEDIDYEDED